MQVIQLVVGGMALLMLALLPLWANGASSGEPSLESLWTIGVLTEGVGLAGIEVVDLTSDGTPEIVTCGAGAPYVLRKGVVDYDLLWYGEAIGCRAIATGDRDGDGVKELYVLASESIFPNEGRVLRVEIFQGETFERLGQFSIPHETTFNRAMTVGDVDGDDALEIVVTSYTATRIYDAVSYALEWDGSGYGGTDPNLGDLTGDGDIEIVVNRNPGLILDGTTHTVEGTYPGGFGFDLALGDVDADGKDEIAYVLDPGSFQPDILTVFDYDTGQIKWTHQSTYRFDGVAVAEITGNGAEEILTTLTSDVLLGWNGHDGTQVATLDIPSDAAPSVAAGDVDRDGRIEVLGGSGFLDDGVLFVGDAFSNTVEWASPDWTGPLAVAAADLEGDGSMEIVVLAAGTDGNQGLGKFTVYDAVTHDEEWSQGGLGNPATGGPANLLLAQMDSDPAVEILSAISGVGAARVRVYDGITHMQDWESPELDSGEVPVWVGNIDSDGRVEIIVGSGNRVRIFDGMTPVFQWDSTALENIVMDIAVADIRGDEALEMVVLAGTRVYLYELADYPTLVETRVVTGSHPYPRAVTLLPRQNSGDDGEVIVALATGENSEYWRLEAWNGADLDAEYWGEEWNSVWMETLESMDIDGDGIEEFILGGSHLGPPPNYFVEETILRVGAHSGTGYTVKADIEGYWNYVTSIAAGDVDGDGTNELLFGTGSLAQVSRWTGVVATPTPTPTQVPSVTSIPTTTGTSVPATFTATLIPVTASATATITNAPPTSTETSIPPSATVISTHVSPTATYTARPVTATVPPTPTGHLLYLPLIGAEFGIK